MFDPVIGIRSYLQVLESHLHELKSSQHVHLRLSTVATPSKAVLPISTFSKRRPLRAWTQSQIENQSNTNRSRATTVDDSDSNSTIQRKHKACREDQPIDLKHIQVVGDSSDFVDVDDQFVDIPESPPETILPTTVDKMWYPPPSLIPSRPAAMPSPPYDRAQDSLLVLGPPTPNTLSLIHDDICDRDDRCR